MVDKRIIDYIKNQLHHGSPIEEIKRNLINAGWVEKEINEAIILTQKKTSKKNIMWTIIGVVVITLIIVGVVLLFIFKEGTEKSEGEKKSKGQEIVLKDCETDFDCFIQASAKCNPAKVFYTNSYDVLSMITTETKSMELKGIKEEKCSYSERVENAGVTFNDELKQQMLNGGATQEEIIQQEQEATKSAQTTIGTRIDCKFDIAGLPKMLENWKLGQINVSVSYSNGETVYEGDYKGCQTVV